MSAKDIPSTFIWTKIQADAGQDLNRILRRKELERLSGGTFWWGIGESKATKIGMVIATDLRPIVIFSRMRTAPPWFITLDSLQMLPADVTHP
jgi:hypothetical protein